MTVLEVLLLVAYAHILLGSTFLENKSLDLSTAVDQDRALDVAQNHTHILLHWV